MASTIKTLKTNASVKDFIDAVEDEQKRKDSHELVKIFESITKEKATMRGTSIIGFGQYHYKSEKSVQEGDRPLTGFSPRKANMTLYVMLGLDSYKDIIDKIGKCKTSKGSCFYFKRLSDLDPSLLKELITRSFQEMKKKHPST